MTNERYKRIQYIIRRLQHHMQICDELHDEETTQRQNFGANMETESFICKRNEERLIAAFTKIDAAVLHLQQIDP